MILRGRHERVTAADGGGSAFAALRAGSALVAAALVALGVLISPAGATSGPLNASGAWVNKADFSSVFHLKESADQHTLTARWNGGSGVHSGIVGSFTGTLNPDGNSYTGPMHVSEGSSSTSGTMTFEEATPSGSRIPRLVVAYIQDNGVAGNFTLEAYALDDVAPPPPSGLKAILEFFCPTAKPCRGDTAASLAAGGAAGIDLPASRAEAAAMPKILASAHFSVPAGHAAKITLTLNKAGRNLLNRRGTLIVVLLIKVNASSGLPPVTNAGTVTFHKK